ncbi:MAG TPA: LysR family transcriptional regulator [Tepidisphaeraceae bacterium]|jgi:DNA-binding transcriptional LysR family regulator|nr:LysR family transcriptional regulator [Tepidisphaeraceae bacterium]
MLDVHQLKIFAAVAENLSFTRAAERLFLTQSAVSHQIARLEREIGCPLLERQGRAVTLTAAGREMATQARRVFAAVDEAMLAAAHAGRPNIGRLRIGASSTACQYIIPEALREFRECFPGYSLAIIPGDSPATAERVANGEVDLGLMVRLDRQKNLTYHELFDDELLFLVSPLHPWAKTGKVERKELAEQHMVLYSRNSATFRLVERYFLKMRVPLRDWIELGDMGAIKELVKLGLGVSVTGEWTARPELKEKSLVLLPVPGSRLHRSWCIANAAGREISMAEQTFIGLCQAVARDLVVGRRQ